MCAMNSEEVCSAIAFLYLNQETYLLLHCIHVNAGMVQNLTCKLQTVVLAQVSLSTKDVVAAMGKTDHPNTCLFTKVGKLKKDLGEAHKGWYIISKKGSTKESSKEAALEAKEFLGQMYLDAEQELRSGVFVFGRQNLGMY